MKHLIFPLMILLAGTSTAIAKPLCYSVTAAKVPTDMELNLPEVLILEDKPLTGLLAEFSARKKVKPIDWVGGPDKARFQGELGLSYWESDMTCLHISIGDGFSGISLMLEKSTPNEGYDGTAEHYADVPPTPGTEFPSYKVQLRPVSCPVEK